MEKEVIIQIFGWDVINWSKTLKFWEKHVSILNKEYQCLEVGSRFGGLSLWLALNNNNVLCTDINGPEEGASEIHKKYKCDSRIVYDALDATNIPFENRFDIVMFKSVLGGISSNNNRYKALTINEIHKALKPGGALLFAENLESTTFHKILRKRYGAPGWNYLKMSELEEVFNLFSKVSYTTVGFVGCFGRTERQRRFLGRIDTLIEKIVPEKSRYILIGVAIK
jgi:SAM-dependent methyltransferase